MEYNAGCIDNAIKMATEFGANSIVTYSYFNYLNKRPEDELWIQPDLKSFQ